MSPPGDLIFPVKARQRFCGRRSSAETTIQSGRARRFSTSSLTKGGYARSGATNVRLARKHDATFLSGIPHPIDADDEGTRGRANHLPRFVHSQFVDAEAKVSTRIEWEGTRAWLDRLRAPPQTSNDQRQEPRASEQQVTQHFQSSSCRCAS